MHERRVFVGERILIRGARVLSPADGLDCALDVLADESGNVLTDSEGAILIG